jgi:hypothetical protein
MKFLREFINKRVLLNVFISSRHPLRFEELLKANQYHDDGLLINPKQYGFRLRLGRAYMLYLTLLNVIVLPILGIFHVWLVHADCHLSILLVMIATWVFFALFTIFKEWLYELMTLKRITDAWSLHLPLFDYSKHHIEVADIYTSAMKQNIGKHDLQMFVLDELSKRT